MCHARKLRYAPTRVGRASPASLRLADRQGTGSICFCEKISTALPLDSQHPCLFHRRCRREQINLKRLSVPLVPLIIQARDGFAQTANSSKREAVAHCRWAILWEQMHGFAVRMRCRGASPHREEVGLKLFTIFLPLFCQNLLTMYVQCGII